MPRIIIHPDGRREVAEDPTEAPQVGAAPRLADGTTIGTDGVPVAPATAPQPARQRPARARKAAVAPAPAAAPANPPPAEAGSADTPQTEG